MRAFGLMIASFVARPRCRYTRFPGLKFGRRARMSLALNRCSPESAGRDPQIQQSSGLVGAAVTGHYCVNRLELGSYRGQTQLRIEPSPSPGQTAGTHLDVSLGSHLGGREVYASLEMKGSTCMEALIHVQTCAPWSRSYARCPQGVTGESLKSRAGAAADRAIAHPGNDCSDLGVIFNAISSAPASGD